MSFYINKNTLEVLETDDLNKYKCITTDFVEYPYDEYLPEKYDLESFQNIDELFNISNSATESIKNINHWYRTLMNKYTQYDYITFVHYEYEYNEDGYMEIIHQLKAYGCYQPSAERVKAWYQTQRADVEREKTRSRKYVEDSIKDLTKRLDEAKLRLEELK